MKRSPPKSKRKPAAVERAGLADALFTVTQQRVMGLLFGQPGRSYYATEMIGLTGAGSGAVQRELERLVQSGLVSVRMIGKQKHYQANSQSPLFAPLCEITVKTFGLAEPLRAALQPLAADIKAAFVYGSVAKREDTSASDVDVMILSDSLDYADVFSVLESVTARVGRQVNPTIYTVKDFNKRYKDDNPFLKRVLEQPKVWLMGGENDLRVSKPMRPKQAA